MEHMEHSREPHSCSTWWGGERVGGQGFIRWLPFWGKGEEDLIAWMGGGGGKGRGLCKVYALINEN